MSEEWERGYAAGWRAHEIKSMGLTEEGLASGRDYYIPSKAAPKRKRRQSAKQKLLKTMTDAKWKKYSRGSGKKTWVQIRAEVSRSQLYKKKARRLK